MRLHLMAPLHYRLYDIVSPLPRRLVFAFKMSIDDIRRFHDFRRGKSSRMPGQITVNTRNYSDVRCFAAPALCILLLVFVLLF